MSDDETAGSEGTATSKWYWGAIINVAGCIAINLGTNVMKLGHNKRAALDMADDKKPSISRFREWQIGVVVFAIGNIANFLSFGFAAQSLLAALGSIQFVTNVIFASTVLKEKITVFILVATGLIISGCILLVIFGDHSSAVYTGDELLDLYTQPVYITYLCLGFAAVVGCYALYLYGRKVTERPGRSWHGWVQVLPITYSLFSALIGTQSVLFSKSLSVLIRATFNGSNQMGNWYTWVTLVCFVISAGFWMTRLNKGLRMFSAMIIVPLLQICWTLFSILEGLLYFEEYQSFTPLRAGMFAVGVVVIFVGVYLLTKSGQKKKDEGYEKVEGAAGQGAVTNPAFEPEQDQDALLGPGQQGSSSSPVRTQPGSPQRGSRDFGEGKLKQRVKDLSMRVKSDFGIELNQEMFKATLGLKTGPGGVVGMTGNIWDPHVVGAAVSGEFQEAGSGGGGGGGTSGELLQGGTFRFHDTSDVEYGHNRLHVLETIAESPAQASRAESQRLSTGSISPDRSRSLNAPAAAAAAAAAEQQSRLATAAGSDGGAGGPVPTNGLSVVTGVNHSGSPLTSKITTGVQLSGQGQGSRPDSGSGAPRAPAGASPGSPRGNLDALKQKFKTTVEENINRAKVAVDEAVSSTVEKLKAAGVVGGDDAYQAFAEHSCDGGPSARRAGVQFSPCPHPTHPFLTYVSAGVGGARPG